MSGTTMRLGADPEVLLQNKSGKLISSIGMIGAGKLDPYQIPNMEKGFTLQEDNVTLEYGIPPASSAKEFSSHIENVMLQSLEYVKGLSFSKLSCAVYDADQMQNPAAHVFGCEPDFNAWTNDYNPGPQPPHPFMRSAGGHVHVETKADPLAVVRAMDLFLGIPSVLMDEGEERRKLYGKAGAHRVKDYGVEYRTLSNFWIFSADLREWVWRSTEDALAHLGWAEDVGEEIQRSINFGDKALARELVDAFKLELV
jgi:Phage phiEco32-like COOH.NH2 ligase-type 2